MSQIFIDGIYKVTKEDKLTIKEAKAKLLPCPICGSKAYSSKDIVDGFYFGWSVGCPRFCINDGIHNIDQDTPEEKHLSVFGLNSAEECVKYWNEKVKNYEK